MNGLRDPLHPSVNPWGPLSVLSHCGILLGTMLLAIRLLTITAVSLVFDFVNN